ncbi:hypothetical protein D1AOALGA4SA_629 [Olavius algarvensis Delta 1 endosymbiont]|nr:hypothetical protein D1AOALGA4SA_629 [Olavius algarvensis Delta 1 endosymbiont]
MYFGLRICCIARAAQALAPRVALSFLLNCQNTSNPKSRIQNPQSTCRLAWADLVFA